MSAGPGSLAAQAVAAGPQTAAPPILGNNVPLNQRIQRDPRMGAAYARYIREWAALTGEPLMQFVDFSPITQWGAWGLQEYLGQPVEEAPKAQAVRAAMAR